MSSILKLVVVACVMSAGFFASDIYQWFKMRAQVKPLSEYCLLTTQACELGKIGIKVDRDISQPLVPTKITVDWPNAKQQSLFMTLQGYEMEMGTLMFKLNKSGASQYSGLITLPVCTTNTMTWVGQITDGQQSVSASIRMEQ
ncbi:hypothetical protein [Vibrio pectenicida]|uniref:Uncharacterized protein n=1 Tax=Vibrio pectenicida TaxID=62763 RepID=A0A3R9F8R0_9VIBR|nr:hypothetical protein [Vibrio pectenicida]RSD32462.1 hypothetical protein EJA03_03665 [Vibrio pectenicida]